VKKDERRALALITMAAENAPAHERIWIEDIYQNIFCGSSQGVRTQADGIVARWRQMFTLPAQPADRMGLGGRELQGGRKCGNGEIIDMQAHRPMGKEPAAPGARPEVMQGSTLGFGLRDAGERPR
jgi:hypothetical protein